MPQKVEFACAIGIGKRGISPPLEVHAGGNAAEPPGVSTRDTGTIVVVAMLNTPECATAFAVPCEKMPVAEAAKYSVHIVADMFAVLPEPAIR